MSKEKPFIILKRDGSSDRIKVKLVNGILYVNQLPKGKYKLLYF